MKGTRVQVYLKTPLYRGQLGAAPEASGDPGAFGVSRTPPRGANALSIDAVAVIGEVLEERRSGLHLKVESLLDESGQAAGSVPFSEMVLPVSKIDYLVFLEGLD